MNKKLLLSLVSAGLFSAGLFTVNPIFAQTEGDLSQDFAAEEVLEINDKLPSKNAVSDISYADWVNQFEQDYEQIIGMIESGRVFYSGESAVNGSPLDNSFGKQLALAYERAMFDLRAEFVMQTYGRLKSKAILEKYEDSSSNKDEFDPVEIKNTGEVGGGKLESMLDKLTNLFDSEKLDSELIAQGLSTDEVESMDVEQKKTNYKNNFNKEMIKRAFGSMQGLVPVQTRIFTEETANGIAVKVGVIAVQSEKTRQFAKDVSKKRKSLVSGTPKNLIDILPKNTDEYLNEIGLRYVYDSNGHPMLLSYGRSSLSVDPSWTPSRVSQSKKNSESMAQMLAESSIVEFINTNIQIEESTDLGSLEEEQLTRLTTFESNKIQDVQDTRQEIRESISKITSSGRATAEGDLRGTSVIKRWDAKDENGVHHVGTVVAWTYDQLENANTIDNESRRKPAASSSNKQKAVDTKSRTSKSINDKSDF